MTYLLDTTVLVDVDRGNAATIAWLARQDAARVYVSSITVWELVRGAYRYYRQDALGLAGYMNNLSTQLSLGFGGRMLSFDREAAEIWGQLVGQGENSGRRPPIDDAKIAAIALAHNLTVATSNTKDFAPLVATVDPRTA